MPMQPTDIIKAIIYKSIIWYCEQSKIKPEDFEKSNDFTKDKISLLPFFICLGGNGSMPILYETLGPFIARSNGPVSKKLEEAINSLDFSGQGRTIVSPTITSYSEADFQENIDKAFQKLKQNMPELITFNYLELLIFAHQFNASYVYRLKHKENDNIITVEDIRQERGYYFLAGMLKGS